MQKNPRETRKIFPDYSCLIIRSTRSKTNSLLYKTMESVINPLHILLLDKNKLHFITLKQWNHLFMLENNKLCTCPSLPQQFLLQDPILARLTSSTKQIISLNWVKIFIFTSKLKHNTSHAALQLIHRQLKEKTGLQNYDWFKVKTFQSNANEKVNLAGK